MSEFDVNNDHPSSDDAESAPSEAGSFFMNFLRLTVFCHNYSSCEKEEFEVQTQARQGQRQIF
jgi:hypothetical protein